MPAVIQYRGCRMDGDLADRVLGVNQTLADRVSAVRAAVAAATPSLDAAAQASANVMSAADAVLAGTTVKSARGFLRKVSVPTAALTNRDAELALLDSDVVMVNGKIIPLDRGTTLADIRALWVALDRDLARTKSLLSSTREGDFIFVVRHVQETVLGVRDACGGGMAPVVDACGNAEAQTTSKDLLSGVDQNPDAVVPAGTPGALVRRQVFWMGRVDASRATFLRLRALGLTDAEVAAAYASEDVEASRLFVRIIDEPSLLASLQAAANARLTDADLAELLSRDVEDVKATFTTGDVAGIISKAISRGLRTRTKGGFKKYAPAAALLAQTIDFRKSFAVDAALEGLGDDALSGAVGNLTDSSSTAVQQSIFAIAGLMPSLNQTFEVMAVVDNMTDTSPLDVILCLLGFDLSFGISISFDALIEAILAFVDAVRGIINALIAVVAAFGDLICFIVGLVNLVLGFANSILECYGVSLSVDVPDFLKGLLQAILDGLRAVLAMVEEVAAKIISFLSFSISLSASAKARASQKQVSCITNSGILLSLTLSDL